MNSTKFEQNQNKVPVILNDEVKDRINTFRAGTLDKLTLLKTVPGGRLEESNLHKTFADYRIRRDREWFKYEGKLKSYIKSL